jgi:hypothetical protein
VCIVTFNYDTMLEAALPTVGLNIRSIGDYVAGTKHKVIKLHGSVNWGREVAPPVDNVGAFGDDRRITDSMQCLIPLVDVGVTETGVSVSFV